MFRCKESVDFALSCALLLGSFEDSISKSRAHIAQKLRNAIIERESALSRQNSISIDDLNPEADQASYSDDSHSTFIQQLMDIGKKLTSQAAFS